MPFTADGVPKSAFIKVEAVTVTRHDKYTDTDGHSACGPGAAVLGQSVRP